MVYQGSKNRISKQIIPILQKEIDDNNIKVFIDGCCGGCNIIDKIKNVDRKIAIDNNPYLIALYNYAVYGEGDFPQSITKDDWNNMKANPSNYEPWLIGLTSIFCSFGTKGWRGGVLR